MIYESRHWKQPVLRTAEWLRRVRLTEQTTERTYVRIEREVFVSFFAVRKLLDTIKVSDRLKSITTELEWHPNRSAVHHMNWENIDHLYDLSQSRKETRDIRFLCNQFIHSFVFLPFEETGRIGGFFVASERDRNKKLYRIRLDQVTSLFRMIARDDPSELFYRLDHDSGRFEAIVR